MLAATVSFATRTTTGHTSNARDVGTVLKDWVGCDDGSIGELGFNRSRWRN